MKSKSNNEKWNMFLKVPVKQQAELIESTIAQGIFSDSTLKEVTGQNKEFILNHFKKKGYELKGNHFIKVNKDIPEESVRDQDEVLKKINEDIKRNQKSEVVPVENNMDELKVYSDVHNILKDVDMTEYIRTSMSFAKQTQNRLDDFLMEYKLLKKQDIITAAIESFLNQYKK